MRITDNINIERVEKFLSNHPQANIFQTPEMYEVYKKTKHHEPVFLSVVNEKDETQGILLAVIQKEHSGLLGRLSSRSIIIGGPIIKDNNVKILELLLAEYDKRVKHKAIYSQYRNHWNWSDDALKIFDKYAFKYEPHLDILIDLNKSEDGLFAEMHKGRRKNIRRASRIPLLFEEVKTDKEFDRCIDLIVQTYQRVKLPCPDRSFFLEADNELKSDNILRKFVAKYNDVIIGTRFELCYNGLIYDWYAGTDDEYLDKYPNDLLPWEIIKWGKNNSYNTFDFGGAGKPDVPYGVRDFKLKFGGELIEFGRFEKVHMVLLFELGKMAFKIYKKIK